MVSTNIFIIRLRRVIRGIHVHQIGRHLRQIQCIAPDGSVGFPVVEYGPVDCFNALDKLLSHWQFKVFSTIVIPVSDIGEEASRPFFATSPDQSGFCNGNLIRISQSRNVRPYYINGGIILVREEQPLECIRDKRVNLLRCVQQRFDFRVRKCYGIVFDHGLGKDR